MKKKINITLDDSLLEQLDVLSEKLHLSRSGVISVSLSEYLEKKSVLDNWPQFIEAMNKITASEIAKQ